MEFQLTWFQGSIDFRSQQVNNEGYLRTFDVLRVNNKQKKSRDFRSCLNKGKVTPIFLPSCKQ